MNYKIAKRANGSLTAMPSVKLRAFNNRHGFERGRGTAITAIWYLTKIAFFLTAIPWPSKVKTWILRVFGAQVGERCVIKPRVNIHFPWKLQVGDDTWIGEEVFILNFEPVTIGSDCCISQRAFLCTGNHNFRDETFCYRNAPISISDGCWIGAQAFVAPGISIGDQSVVSAGSIVMSDIAQNKVCKGNPCEPVADRWK